MTNEELEQKEHEIIIEYLEKATPEQCHIFAASSNYDSNRKALEWLINNPKIDKATALLIYWNLGAAWFVQFASESDAENSAYYNLKTYKLLRILEKRYADGFYANHNIWFDPMKSEGGRPDDYPKIPVNNKIPEYMLKPVGTKSINLFSEDYDEGLALEVCEKISELYN